jgi:MazG family protein
MVIVGLGAGDVASVPGASLEALAGRTEIVVGEISDGVRELLGGTRCRPLGTAQWPGSDVVIAATDPEAYALAERFPDADTVPDRATLRERAIGAQVARLVRVGGRLRRECPWDREQTIPSIVPYTIEEAFEVADAVESGDPAKQHDEVGDLLFQSVFLAQLLEEQDHGDLGTIARDQADKLISRHPHVYGDVRAEDSDRVLDLWEASKRIERADQGIFHDLPPGLPALAFATKAQKRAAAVGFTLADLDSAIAALVEEVGELARAPSADELGDVLFAAVAIARQLKVDPEVALRGTAQRFRRRVERAVAAAAAAGERFDELAPEDQLGWYEAVGRDPEISA